MSWLLILALAACHQSSTPAVPPDLQQDYAVYTAIIDLNCPKEALNPKPLLIVGSKTAPMSINGFRDLIQPSDSISGNGAWLQFAASVDSSQFNVHDLSGSIPSACQQTQVLTDNQVSYYFVRTGGKGIDGLRKDFPNFNSYLTFSSVAYSADGAKAICFMSSVCGGLCGSGNLYFLSKTTNGWRVAKITYVWIS